MPYDGIDHERKAKCVQEATTAGAKGAALGLGRGPLLIYILRLHYSTFSALNLSPHR